MGTYALLSNNNFGDANTAIGFRTSYSNQGGTSNTSIGHIALESNSGGNDNTAVGRGALNALTGDGNTAVGRSALSNLDSGTNNTAIGYSAGSGLTSGSNNVYLGNVTSPANESNVTRIGNTSTAATYIHGVYSPTVSTRAVYVNGSGQLGTLSSSRRFKTDIRSIGSSSGKLLQLRPVSFRYKRDVEADAGLQYGLIAEEVAKVFPELVEFDAAGKPYTVRYHLLSALLLSELQKQNRAHTSLRRQVEQQQHELTELRAYKANLEERLERIERTVEAASVPGGGTRVRRAAAAAPDLDM